MIFAGFQECSFIDFEGTLSCVAFASGCNLRCRFCHNGDAVHGIGTRFSEKEVKDRMENLVGKVEGFVLTGGEPLLYGADETIRILRHARNLGFRTKLDTNGMLPDELEKVIFSGMCDHIAIDLKACDDESYRMLCGPNARFENILKSIGIVRKSGIGFECRTTVIDGFHDIASLERIGKIMESGEKIYLQKYIPDRAMDADDDWRTPTDSFLEGVRIHLRKSLIDCIIR